MTISEPYTQGGIVDVHSRASYSPLSMASSTSRSSPLSSARGKATSKEEIRSRIRSARREIPGLGHKPAVSLDRGINEGWGGPLCSETVLLAGPEVVAVAGRRPRRIKVDSELRHPVRRRPWHPVLPIPRLRAHVRLVPDRVERPAGDDLVRAAAALDAALLLDGDADGGQSAGAETLQATGVEHLVEGERAVRVSGRAGGDECSEVCAQARISERAQHE